jgi:hypothetical protein
MSKNRVSQVRLHGVSIALGTMLVGCFDPMVTNIGDAGTMSGAGGSRAIVPALLIDDFEDGNRVPSDLQFGPWRCYSYGDSSMPAAKCGVATPGYMSLHGYYVDFELVDTANGKSDYPGVSLRSQTVAKYDAGQHGSVTAFDASQYGAIVFSVMLAPRDQPLARPVIVMVDLGCGGVSDQPEPSDGVFAISLGAELNEPIDGWHTFSLDLSKFIQFPWAKQRLAIDRDLCVQRVDGIQFSYQLEYAIGDASVDGQSAAATMTFDKVYFQ